MSFMSPFPGQLSSYYSDMKAHLCSILGLFGVHRPIFWHHAGEPQSTKNLLFQEPFIIPPKLTASHLPVKFNSGKMLKRGSATL